MNHWFPKYNFGSKAGFTLLELIVVMALIGITLFLTLPRLRAGLVGDPMFKMARQMVFLTKQLRAEALSRQMDLILRVDLDEQKFGVVMETGGDSEQSGQPDGSGAEFQTLPEGVNVVDIIFPRKEKITGGRVDIGFFRQGYADQALVHLQDWDNDQALTLFIEPYLTHVQIKKGYHLWED